MSLMGTLAKVAIGYATARGVDKMSGGGGLGALMGGLQGGAAQPKGGEAANPMAAMMQQMMGGDATSRGAAGGMDLQAMMANFMGGGAQTGQASAADSKGGLLSALSGGAQGGGAGLAGLFAAMGGMAAATGKGSAEMIDKVGAMSPPQPEAEQNAALLLRAMIQAAKSDGDIDPAERAKILETVGDDADAEDIAFVQAQLAAPVNVESLAKDTPDALKMQVYAMSMMSIRVDTPAEKAYMADLAGALGIDDTTARMLNMQMGVNA